MLTKVRARQFWLSSEKYPLVFEYKARQLIVNHREMQGLVRECGHGLTMVHDGYLPKLASTKSRTNALGILLHREVGCFASEFAFCFVSHDEIRCITMLHYDPW